MEAQPKTEPTTPAPTGDDPSKEAPTATEPQGKGAATEETVTLPKSHYNNLIAQRDRSNEQLNQVTDAVVNMQKKSDIESFLADNADKYPDVVFDDLKHAESPDELDELAKNAQNRITAATQKRLAEVQTGRVPQLSPQDRATREAELKKNPGSKSFAEMVRLRTST